MKRLTRHTEFDTAVVCENCTKRGNCNIPSSCINVLAERLAAYEDTGYTPEEIRDHSFAPVCIGCEGKDEHGYRTEKCDYDKSFVKCIRQAKHLAELAEAELDGRIIMLPCKIGAKVRDINADYVFTVEKVETCIVYDKPALIFRCGNPGTKDYTAFYDFEIGKDIEILAEECANG